ncbi:MAG TPA: hypothetical protein VMW52_07185 [Phycisphaerae bacterium]|nr:hypothetical protein [Phycisphaerae bacterium]
MSRKADNELASEVRCEQMVPPWIQRMREMSQKHLTEDVVESIVVGQIERAKKGDRNAIRFVFDQLMGGQALRGATFVQNNYGGDFCEPPDKPLPPKGPARIEAMRRRAEQRRPLTDLGDEPDLS